MSKNKIRFMAQYVRLQVKSSEQYLNILNGSTDVGAVACQGEYAETDNFLWTIEEVIIN